MNNYKKLLAILIGTLVFSFCSNKLKNDEEIDINQLIEILKSDSTKHRDVSPIVSKSEIEIFESKIDISLPKSYKIILNQFGNGAGGLYHIDQPVQGIGNKYLVPIEWASKFYNNLPKEFESDGFGIINSSELIFLMADNSNGGAWCWIVDRSIKDNEWPLAFLINQKLYYKVDNFKEWLKIATTCKGEVIRELDKEYKLGLG